ncbi:MAG: ATP-grasp domain-containing protein [bacterium]
MKRTLLVDTNRAAVPIYRALCAMGHEVWVVGGKPSEPLAKLAPNYVQLDYSDAGRLARFVDEKAFDYIVPGCTDRSYKVCADISGGRFPGLDTPANTTAINTKSEFRKAATRIGLSVPRILSMEQAGAVESVIVKPADSFSGRGMTVLRKPGADSLSIAFDNACRASSTRNAIIEEFVAGQLFSHSAFIRDTKVVADFVVQEECVTNSFAVDTSRMASGFPVEMLGSLREDVRRLAVSLQLVDGLVHTQFIAKGSRYWIIEVTRRCPGDLYSLLIELSTGYPYATSYAATFVGEAVVPCPDSRVRDRITRHTVTSRDGAALWGFRFRMPVDIRLFVPLAVAGDFIEASPDGRAGILFFSSSSAGEQEVLYRKLLDGELYRFDLEQSDTGVTK